MSLWVNHRDPEPHPAAGGAGAGDGASEAPTAVHDPDGGGDLRRSVAMVLAAGALAFGITWVLQRDDSTSAATPSSVPAVELRQDGGPEDLQVAPEPGFDLEPLPGQGPGPGARRDGGRPGAGPGWHRPGPPPGVRGGAQPVPRTPAQPGRPS